MQVIRESSSCKVLKSNIDESVNFIRTDPKTEKLKLEARYVRRQPNYFITYLSSQWGCNMGCAFCHLTTTKQRIAKNADPMWLEVQARDVYDYYKQLNIPAREVYFNFMARGEALANPNVNSDLLYRLGTFAKSKNLLPRYNISTIMPNGAKLLERFNYIYPVIYYSIYSMDKQFRKKWLPNASDPEWALDQLKEYQQFTKQIIKLHWSFIEGENDSLEDIQNIREACIKRKLHYEINMVRYNPYSDLQGKESPKVFDIYNRLKAAGDAVTLVDRVGVDVFSSCGQFFN